MNKMMKRAALLAAVFIVSIPLGLMAQDEGYYPYSFARLSYISGAVYVQRTSDLGYEKGEVNLALVQGDKIGTESGQAEIHFGRRNYLRLDDNTKVEFVLLPTEGEERIKIHLTEGRAYFRVSHLALDKGIEIHTPDASFYVLEEGLYRFDVNPAGETQATAREGSLEAATEDGSVLVRYQESVTAVDGRLLGDPAYGNSRGDAFDDWNGGRDEQLSTRSEKQYLPSEMEEYEEELDQNGHWVYERPYGNVWVPNVSYYDDWRPYSYGRWVWYPVIGWTWVSSESWGWPVYHYGRWNWRFGLGWYWIPRHHWGPAWVHWWWDRDHVGWCPLTWYNRPGYLFNDRFYDRYDDRWFSARNRAMTVVRRDHLQSSDIGRRHLGVADLDRIGRVDLRAQQPSIRPSVDNSRPQAVAARRVLADRSGVRTQVKAHSPSNSLASPRLRQGGERTGLRSGEHGAARPEANRTVVSRPSIRGSETGGRTIRSYPSQGLSGNRDQDRISENRRTTGVSPERRTAAGSGDSPARITRSQTQPSGSSKPATVRESQPSRTSGSGSRSSEIRRDDSVKKDPSISRPSSTDKSPSSASTPRTVRSAPDRSSESSARRSQSRTYASSNSVTRPSERISSSSSSSRRSSPSVARPSSSERPSTSSLSRSGSSRTPSSSRARVSSPSSSSRSSSPSYARPSASRPSSSSQPRGSYSAPSRSSGSSGRSYAAPRSSSQSSGRSVSAPRSGGSSPSRSSGSVRSGGSSGRSSSSSSKSSGSSSKSGGAKRKG